MTYRGSGSGNSFQSHRVAALLAWCDAADVWIDPRIQLVDMDSENNEKTANNGEHGDGQGSGMCVYTRDKAVEPYTTRECPFSLFRNASIIPDSIYVPSESRLVPLAFFMSVCPRRHILPRSGDNTQDSGVVSAVQFSLRAHP